ncbi:crotonase/enoyl-CoA hydratase family protein [Neobacillus niacini]|uniref:crotonase/enoyl-CoA hydratase family protein n=1 Tax=Neobacillus niacini TaxID=86668 RepID=UPI0020410A7E|nr:crotonase/enoyl-CoA hydratase family protein [Neobacillus niacini]MCM3691208.1 crotonase/enoyl-CoA hydratase family protein [Neobacillus niacini]
MFETIKVDITNQIMTITLHRPDRLNAFNSQMLQDLFQAFDQADEDDNVRVIIMTGEGRAYCAGADLGKGGDTFRDDSPPGEHRDEGGLLSLRIYELKKPIIAAINGPAVGVGVTMTLPMDIRIASINAKMGFVFARRGIIPEACSGWFLPRAVGISQAIEWVSTGRIFKAEEALEKGLVSRVVSPEDLLPTARKIAAEIAENTSAISVALARQLMWRMLGAEHPVESHKVESKIMHWIGQQADAKEGVTSFLEKREANFKMKVSTDLPGFYPWWEKKESKV